MKQSRSCLNRADLLAVLDLGEPTIAGFLAKQLRLEVSQEAIIELEPISMSVGLSSTVDLETNWQSSQTPSQLNALFWVVERSEMRETTNNPSEQATPQLAVPQWRGRPSQRPKFYPLASPRYLLPRLFQHLKHQRHSREIDMQRMVKKVSKGEYLYQLPRRQRRSLGRHLHIIEDHHLHLVPYWLDQSLYKQVLQARLPDYAYSHEVVQEGQSFIQATIPENSVVLVFSDLGALPDQPHESISFWWQVGKVYERLGCKLIAITPCHSEACDERLRELFEIVSWQPARHMAKTDKATLRAQADELLTLLAPVIRLEPALLRSLRLALAQHGFKFPIEVEAVLWQHIEVIEPSSVAATLNSDGRKQRLEHFKHYPDAVKQIVLNRIREWRAPLAEQVWYEEMISLDEFSRALVPETDWQDAEGYIRYLDQQSEVEEGLESNTRAWFKRMTKRLPEPAWSTPNVGECLQRITGRLYADKDLPYAIDPQVLKSSSLPERVLRIYQQGQQLTLGQVEHPLLKIGGRLADIKYQRGLLYVEAGAFKQTFHFAEDEPAFQVLCELPSEGELVLRTDLETLYLGQMSKPEWAIEIGRDEFGVYGDLNIKGVVQRFRFIQAGTFMMGSPDTEEERGIDELYHQATLKESFWLSDTAITQNLWLVATGLNPSSFKISDYHPVENVSWLDIQDFIDNIHGCFVLLPTETQWEYACRAGTTTPFYYGNNITTNYVNYDGNYPYNNGEKGYDRSSTVSVKSFLPNHWGLYEMHGNVWEWCRDRYVIEDLERDICFVLKGGAWLYSGKDCRSASKAYDMYSSTSSTTGFRIVIKFKIKL